MSQAASDDDLDALLASLLVGPASPPEPEPVAEPDPVAHALPLPTLTPAAVKVIERFRAWLDSAEPAAIWPPCELDPPVPAAEPLDADTLLEMAAARAWREGGQKAFDEALARLPVDRAQHHRRVAAVVEMSRMRQEARARGGSS